VREVEEKENKTRVMPDAKVYHTVVAHVARMRIILVFWSFARGYEPRLDNAEGGRAQFRVIFRAHLPSCAVQPRSDTIVGAYFGRAGQGPKMHPRRVT
jgi:hypothetical protein